MLENYTILEKFEDTATVYIDKDYNKVILNLEYRGLAIEFKLIEFIVLLSTLAQAASKIEVDKIDMESELGRLEGDLKEAVALVKEGAK